MSPSKRAEHKTNIMLWVDKDLHARFARMAEASGLSMTSILSAHIIACIDEYESKKNKGKQNANRAPKAESRKRKNDA